MTKDTGSRTRLWLWTWIFVAVSSAGYAVVNLLSSTPADARGMVGTFRYLLDVALPIGMCALATWLAVEEGRGATGTA